MTYITFQDGRVVMRDGKVGTGQGCCCGGGCENCGLTCCLTIQGKNTCIGGTDVITSDPPAVVNWGSTINEIGATAASYQYLSDAFDFTVLVDWVCENGQISMDVQVSEAVPGGTIPATSYRRWPNAVAILGPDGCPTGVDLGELTESDGPEPATALALAWLCT